MSETTSTRGQAAAPDLAGARVRFTSRPQTFAEQLLNSSAVWLALMAYWAGADLLHGAFPPGGRQVPPDGWLTHLALTLVGLAAIWCMHRSGFPAAWDTSIPARRRLALPLLAGVLFGLLLGGILANAIFLVPDLGWTLALAGAAAVGWGLLRTAIALHLLRRPTVTVAGVSPTHA